MRTVHLTLDEELVGATDMAAKLLRTSRSALMRKALRDALRKLTIELERQHRRGYQAPLVKRGEFI